MGIEPIVSALRGQCVKPIPLIRHITSKLKDLVGFMFHNHAYATQFAQGSYDINI